MNDNVKLWIDRLVYALVLFLAGWVWNMESRVNTLETATEIRMQANAEAIKDIQADIKVILRELTHP